MNYLHEFNTYSCITFRYLKLMKKKKKISISRYNNALG